MEFTWYRVTLSGVGNIEPSFQEVSSPALISIRYLSTPTSSALNGGAQDKFTDLDVKATVRGLPGASNTPEKYYCHLGFTFDVLCKSNDPK